MTELKMKEVKTTSYKKPDIEKGYTNQTLHINISDAAVSLTSGCCGMPLNRILNGIHLKTRYVSHPVLWEELPFIRGQGKVS